MAVQRFDRAAEQGQQHEVELVGVGVDSERVRAEGLRLTGEAGLLARLIKVVVESALEGEMDDHLGCGKHDPAGRNGGTRGDRG